ncbi:3-isopropylmalate dehydratase, partial [Verminephrobacter sp. Larva24]
IVRPALVAPDGRLLACEPVPGFLMDMVRAGGLLNQLRQRAGRPAFTKAPDV